MFEKTMTPYQYAYQNPVKYIDPTGMEGESADNIIIIGKDNHKWTIKAEGKDKTINVPLDLGSDKNIDLGLGNININTNRIIVVYTVNVGLEGSLGIGVSGNVNVTVTQFTDPTYAGYNYVYVGGEHVGSAGAQFSISASAGASVFIGYNNSDDPIRPQDFSGNYYTIGLSADIKEIVGGGISGSIFSSTSEFNKPGWKGISVGLSVGVGEAINYVSGTVGRGYTYLLNDVKPTSQRGMIDRAVNKVSPISSALGSYGVRKAQQLLR